ncbi:unnamed protein product, partial [Durusdinium trenchii]
MASVTRAGGRAGGGKEKLKIERQGMGWVGTRRRRTKEKRKQRSAEELGREEEQRLLPASSIAERPKAAAKFAETLHKFAAFGVASEEQRRDCEKLQQQLSGQGVEFHRLGGGLDPVIQTYARPVTGAVAQEAFVSQLHALLQQPDHDPLEARREALVELIAELEQCGEDDDVPQRVVDWLTTSKP